MTNQSQARRDLERAVRELLPQQDVVSSDASGASTSAVAGVGGAVIGYVWGFVRGRRSRKSRK